MVGEELHVDIWRPNRRNSQCKDIWLDIDCPVHSKVVGVAGLGRTRDMRLVLHNIRELVSGS